jgi:glycosyltransferase involved in cell wall biosynthesis/predicted O-methyltransferase YrrM
MMMSNLLSIPTHLTERERLLLLHLAKSLPAEATIVEIGSYLGASASFLAEGIREKGNKVYAVDTWTNLAMSEGQRDTYAEFLHNTEPLQEWIVPLRGLSTEVSQQFDQQIDLLFVDGDHAYEEVRADLEAWLPKVKNGGIVVFHDYNWAEGVQRAVREFVVPIQTEGGRRLDSIYWTRISHQEKERRQPALRASVIIPTYNRPAYLKDTTQSIQTQDFENEQYEILVVDNGPAAEAKSIVDEVNQNGLHPVQYVREPRVGLHNARHAGAREARGEILVYVDDDVVVHPNWLTAIVSPFADPKVACVGGKVIPKWEVQPPNWWSQVPDSYLSLLDLGEESKELHWPEGAYGCNMAVRRSALYEVGGFNPDGMGDRQLIWFRGDGETGLHRKIYDAGYKVIYNPQAWLYHCIPASRLTPQYFHWRAFIQGISDSYTHIRQKALGKKKMLRHATGCFLRAIRCCLTSISDSDRSQIRMNAWYWYGRGQHQLRAIVNHNLYKHILQDTYL